VVAGGGAQAAALHGWLGAACSAGYMTAVLGDGGDPEPMPTDHGPELEGLRKRLADAKEFL
jgi:hypothetical protein